MLQKEGRWSQAAQALGSQTPTLTPHLGPSMLPPPLPSHPGTWGFPQEPGDGMCLLGWRPHLEFILFMKLVAASQAPAPLIPQSPVHVVNKGSNLFIKNRLSSQQATGWLPAPGWEGGQNAGSQGQSRPPLPPFHNPSRCEPHPLWSLTS